MNPNKRNYRATFILDNRGVEETVEQIIENVKQEIVTCEGEVGEIENLGQRDFARVTDPKRPSGVYVQVDFAAPATAPAALKERLRLNRTVYRTYVQSA
ncbi:30S ribosomal protein S6 [Synoicihabitans lomoniglobus]|uniref:Small ribosomal subunit protein bS6 n=1 Tax=Synoicihabitans lomoniglobus TaxID=2909285 RepID=A0AAF0I1T9_9BACT|nr:30S ribosomal protein S6 [Opitutaceae bacterium LMO-M01]WED66027.1 30S ribosomal protein S6 [Opitutaceae bacterium LMO-M01]